MSNDTFKDRPPQQIAGLPHTTPDQTAAQVSDELNYCHDDDYDEDSQQYCTRSIFGEGVMQEPIEEAPSEEESDGDHERFIRSQPSLPVNADTPANPPTNADNTDAIPLKKGALNPLSLSQLLSLKLPPRKMLLSPFLPSQGLVMKRTFYAY